MDRVEAALVQNAGATEGSPDGTSSEGSPDGFVPDGPSDGTSADGPPGGGPDRPVPTRPPGGPGLRPAMVVLGLAVLILLVFAISAAVTNGGNPARLTPRAGTPVKVPGTSLRAIPGAHVLRSIEQGGEPPANIIRAVSVPFGAVYESTENNSAGAGQYDQQVVLSVHASQLAVFNFFTAELPRWKWQVFSSGPASNQPGTVEVLGKLAGDDGWYWEMGALVSPTTFTSRGLNGTSVAGADTTRFTIRLFQVADEQ